MTALNAHLYGPAEGAPLLAIHGVTAHGRRFEQLAQEALPHRRVIAVDLRGHGASTIEPPWSLDQHLVDLRDTLDAHGVGATDVIGHSFGGCLATNLLATSPERVRRLVLLDPAMALPLELAREAAEETRPDDSWATLAEAVAARVAGQAPQAVEAVRNDATIAIAEDADGRFRRQYSRPAVITGWGEMARAMPAVPADRAILLITAAQAPFVTDAVRRGLPGAVEHVLDCGHVVTWEAFDEVARLVREFLA